MATEPTPAPTESGRWPRDGILAGSLVSAIIAFLLVVLVAPDGALPIALDTWVFDVTTEWTANAAWALGLAETIQSATDPIPATLAAVAATFALLDAGRRRLGLLIAASATVGVIIVETLKRAIGRERPPGAEEYIDSGLDHSMPSGHSAAGIYIYAALALLVILWGMSRGNRRAVWIGRILFALAISIGLSRIVLGVHWATDVLTGWAIGAAVLLLASAVLRPDDDLIGHAEVPRPPASESGEPGSAGPDHDA